MEKTGSTPIPISVTSSKQVINAMKLDTYLVHYVDGYGVETTAIAFKIGDAFRLLGPKSLGAPLQSWLDKAILEKISE